MDGVALCKRLMEERPEYIRRFILLTGAADRGFEDFCKAQGIPVLLKPVDQGQLLRRLRRVLEKTHV